MIVGAIIAAVIGVILVIGTGIIGFVVVPPIIDEQIADNVKLVKDTPQFDRFVTLPQPLEFKVYFMEILNEEAVHAGTELPKMKEKGPYIYLQHRVKQKISFSNNDETIFYDDSMKMEFDAEASHPLTEDDNIKILNPHLNSIIQVAEATLTDFRLNGLNAALSAMFNGAKTLFIETTPKEVLFEGVVFCKPDISAMGKKVCKETEESLTKSIIVTPEGFKFSFFNHKVAQVDGKYELFSGVSDLKQTGILKSKNDSPFLDLWDNSTTSYCNQIRGTDTTMFPPFVKKENSISSYSNDICHSVELYYKHEVVYKGISAYHFEPSEAFLGNTGQEFGNDCFCINHLKNAIVKEDGCLYKGAIDMSSCMEGPIVLTKPHFLDASSVYSSLIEGLQTNPEKHNTFVDVEPRTGNILRGGKRIQLNMFLRKVKKMKITENYKTALVPILWIDEGIELNDEMIKMLNDELFNILYYIDIGIIIGFTLGGVLIVVALILIYFAVKKNK